MHELVKISAERDALLKALKLADEGVGQARAAQQRAEAKANQLAAELQSERAKLFALSRVAPPAPAEQKRVETRIQYLEAQLRGQQMELVSLQNTAEGLRAENRQLQAEVRDLHSQIASYFSDMER